MSTLLTALVRAHSRPRRLQLVLSQLDSYRKIPNLDVDILVLADRPTPAVLDVLRQAETDFGAFSRYSPVPVLDNNRERFLEAQNAHLEWLDFFASSPDWIYVVDDDFWIEPNSAHKALESTILARSDIDAYYMTCLFVQDSPNTYNPERQHRSIRLYRHVPGARFSGTRMLSMPDEAHDAAIISRRTDDFPAPLLEYGGYSEADRATNLSNYARAGKSDPFTASLLSPRREPLPSNYALLYP